MKTPTFLTLFLVITTGCISAPKYVSTNKEIVDANFLENLIFKKIKENRENKNARHSFINIMCDLQQCANTKDTHIEINNVSILAHIHGSSLPLHLLKEWEIHGNPSGIGKQVFKFNNPHHNILYTIKINEGLKEETTEELLLNTELTVVVDPEQKKVTFCDSQLCSMRIGVPVPITNMQKIGNDLKVETAWGVDDTHPADILRIKKESAHLYNAWLNKHAKASTKQCSTTREIAP